MGVPLVADRPLERIARAVVVVSNLAANQTAGSRFIAPSLPHDRLIAAIRPPLKRVLYGIDAFIMNERIYGRGRFESTCAFSLTNRIREGMSC
jgi:hypothetical protein